MLAHTAVAISLTDKVTVYGSPKSSPASQLGVWHTLQLSLSKDVALESLRTHFSPAGPMLYNVLSGWSPADRKALGTQHDWAAFVQSTTPTLWVSSVAGDCPYPPPTSAGTLLL